MKRNCRINWFSTCLDSFMFTLAELGSFFNAANFSSTSATTKKLLSLNVMYIQSFCLTFYIIKSIQYIPTL